MSNRIKQRWQNAKAEFTKKDLTIDGQEVMQSWEYNYMKMLASILTKKGGNTLELGLGMGISSRFILNSKKIKKHTIIEAHPEVLKFGRKEFKKEIKNKRLRLVKGFWQDVINKFPSSSFDGILFETFPLTYNENEIPFMKKTYRLLKKGGVFTFYSNADKNFSERYLKELKNIGFSKIDFKVCKVNPPKKCFYWKKKNIIAHSY